MVSAQASDLSLLLLQEAFGSKVLKVASLIFQQSKLSSFNSQEKEILSILIQHFYVTYKRNSGDKEEGNESEFKSSFKISLQTKRILKILRIPKYLSVIKSSYGFEASELLKEIFKEGRLRGSEAISRLSQHMSFSNVPTSQHSQTLDKLSEFKFILKVKDNSLSDSSDSTTNVEKNMNSNVLWCINDSRLDFELLKSTIVSGVSRRLDVNSGKVMRVLLDSIGHEFIESPLLHFSEISRVIEIQEPELHGSFSQILTLLSEDKIRWLIRIGDGGGGGQYTINFKDILERLAGSALDSVVSEKFGSKALRIFRVIREKKRIEESRLQSLVMIPSKETKLLTYTLLENNFIQIQELRKSVGNNAPSKGFYLFYVDSFNLARNIRELCYKALTNMIIRKGHEFSSHSRILDKNERIESIISSLKESKGNPDDVEEQIAEVRELMTPPEKDVASRVLKTLDIINNAMNQIEETCFLMDMYLVYANETSVPSTKPSKQKNTEFIT